MIADTAGEIDGALPDEVVAQYKQMLEVLTGSNGGADHIGEIRDGLGNGSEQLGDWARNLGEAQVQILAMIIALEIQLDILAAMAFFTGGLSMGEEALAKAETALSLMLVMQRLLAMLQNLVPTFLQAAIGALIMLAASLISNAMGNADPHKPGINWTWVAEGALGGALADLGIRGIGGVFDKAIGDGLKGLDNTFVTALTDVGGDFIKMGGGAAFSSTITAGAITGHWQFSPMMMVGAGVGGALIGGMVRGVGLGGAKYKMMKLDPETLAALKEQNLTKLPPPSPGRGGNLPGRGRGPAQTRNLPAPTSRPITRGPGLRNTPVNRVASPQNIVRVSDPHTVVGNENLTRRTGLEPQPRVNNTSRLNEVEDPPLTRDPPVLAEPLPPEAPPITERTPPQMPPVNQVRVQPGLQPAPRGAAFQPEGPHGGPLQEGLAQGEEVRFGPEENLGLNLADRSGLGLEPLGPSAGSGSLLQRFTTPQPEGPHGGPPQEGLAQGEEVRFGPEENPGLNLADRSGLGLEPLGPPAGSGSPLQRFTTPQPLPETSRTLEPPNVRPGAGRQLGDMETPATPMRTETGSGPGGHDEQGSHPRPENRQPYVEDAPEETVETTVPAPPPPNHSTAAEARAAEALAGLRATVERRDQAYLEFERRLADYPDKSLRLAAREQLVSEREWFADRWTAEPEEGRSGLGQELGLRLDQARRVVAAQAVFERDVLSTVRGEHSFQSGPRVAALREEFVEAMTGPAATPEARAQLVEDFRGQYDRAREQWRQRLEAQRAFEAALTFEDPVGRIDLRQGGHGWDDTARAWYSEALTRLGTSYANERAARPDLTSQDAARLADGVRNEALRLSAEATAVAELKNRLEQVSARHEPSPEWDPQVQSWYRGEQATLLERMNGMLRGRQPGADLRARLESDYSQQLDALHEVAHTRDLERQELARTRDLAHQQFDRFLARQEAGQTIVRSRDTVEWAGRQIDDLREAYVRDYVADVTASGAKDREGSFIPEPSYAERGGWRSTAWRTAQVRVDGTHEGLFARHAAEVAGRPSAADRQAFDEVFESWMQQRAGNVPADHLDAVRDRAREAYERQTFADDQDRAEILDGLRDQLDLQAARQIALQRGRDAYERAFRSWRHLLAEGETTPEDLPFALSDTAADTVREQVRTGFEREWNTAVEDIFGSVSDIHADLPRNMREAAGRLKTLTDGLRDAFDRRGRYESGLDRFTELFPARADSFRDHLTEADRSLLAGFRAQDAGPSEHGRNEVVLGGLRELDTAYTELFADTTEVTPETLKRWGERFDQVVDSIPARLAAQTAREAALTRMQDDVDTAIESWRTGSPEINEAFRSRFGVEFGGETSEALQHSLKRALGRSVNDRFGEIFGSSGVREGELTGRLEEWNSWYDEATGKERLHTWLAVETARQSVVAESGRIFGERSADWRQAHPERTLSQDDLDRAREGLDERMLDTYNEVFGVAVNKPEDLTGRVWVWDERVADLSRELPTHLGFEAEVPAMLKGAGRSYHALSERYNELDDVEWGNRAREAYREDMFDEYRVLFAPPDLSLGWQEREAATTNAFETGRAEAIADTLSETQTALSEASPPAEVIEAPARVTEPDQQLVSREPDPLSGRRYDDPLLDDSDDPGLYPAVGGRMAAPMAPKAGPASAEWLERVVRSGLQSIGASGATETHASGASSDFVSWIGGTGPEPAAGSSMNSWEAIFLTAYRAGAVSMQWLERVHQTATFAADAVLKAADGAGLAKDTAYELARRDYIEMVQDLSRWERITEHSVSPGSVPAIPAGHWLWISGPGRPDVHHAALVVGTRDAGGRQQVLSHPHSSAADPESYIGRPASGPLRMTTIEELLEEFGEHSSVISMAPAWADPKALSQEVLKPGTTVTNPAPFVIWQNQRFHVQIATVNTERAFDAGPKFPLKGGLPEEPDNEIGRLVLVREHVQLIQAPNDQWIRNQVTSLPVKPVNSVTPEQVAALERALNRELNAYVNKRYYGVPESGQQIHLQMKLVVDPDHGEAITLGPGVAHRLDARNWGLRDNIYRLLHETFHYFGISDQYVDRLSLFRDNKNRPAIKTDGIMSDAHFHPSQPMPAHTLATMEEVVDRTVVLYGHPWNPPPSKATEQPKSADLYAWVDATFAPRTLTDDLASDDSGLYPVVGRRDDSPLHSGALAPRSRDYVRDWRDLSSVAGLPRSRDLGAIDRAVERLPRVPSGRDLRRVLEAVEAWKSSRSTRNPRWGAVTGLERAVRGMRDANTSYAATEEPVAGPLQKVSYPPPAYGDGGEDPSAFGQAFHDAPAATTIGRETVLAPDEATIGLSGVSYPGPSRLPEAVSSSGDPDVVHRGEFEVETVEGAHYVRVYTAIADPVAVTPTAGRPGMGTSALFKDVNENPKSGVITIAMGGEGTVFWTGVGRPQRAVQWLLKYQYNYPTLQPVLRTFLVPLDTYVNLSSRATLEYAARAHPSSSLNVDFRSETNQFGVRGADLEALARLAKPGSLISYVSSASGVKLQGLAGEVRPVSELFTRLGIDGFQSDALGKEYDPWFRWTWDEAENRWTAEFRTNGESLHGMARELRQHHVTYQQSLLPAEARTPSALLESDVEGWPGKGSDTKLPTTYAGRRLHLNVFLNKVGPPAESMASVVDKMVGVTEAAAKEILDATTDPPPIDTKAAKGLVKKVLPPAARDLVSELLWRIRSSYGVVRSVEEFRTVLDGTWTDSEGTGRDFKATVLTPLVKTFSGKVEQDRQLARWLSAEARRDLADVIRTEGGAAVDRQLTKIAQNPPTRWSSSARDGWLGGLSGHAPRLIAGDLPMRKALEAAIDRLDGMPVDLALMRESVEHELVPKIRTASAANLRRRDFVDVTPDAIRAMVTDELLPDMVAAIEKGLSGDDLLKHLPQDFRVDMAERIAARAGELGAAAAESLAPTPVTAAQVREFMENVPAIATQMEISALIAADYDRLVADPGLRTVDPADVAAQSPFSNDFADWRDTRAEREESQGEVGRRLTGLLASGGTPQQVARGTVEGLIAELPELAPQFDAITVPTEKFTFYDHAQLVLGQFLTLAGGAPDFARFVSADTVAKAILFHDIEKVASKVIFGDEAGSHDREPEHRLAAAMMQRYAALWPGYREFLAARALVDSDPIGLYLRGRHDADTAFTYIVEWAYRLRVARDAEPIEEHTPERTAWQQDRDAVEQALNRFGRRPPADLTTLAQDGFGADAQRFFTEFHEYYQADFSSYTPTASYQKKGETTLRHAANRDFAKELVWKDGTVAAGGELQRDGTRFAYSEKYEERYQRLSAMFASPDAIAEHYERIRTTQAEQLASDLADPTTDTRTGHARGSPGTDRKGKGRPLAETAEATSRSTTDDPPGRQLLTGPVAAGPDDTPHGAPPGHSRGAHDGGTTQTAGDAVFMALADSETPGTEVALSESLLAAEVARVAAPVDVASVPRILFSPAPGLRPSAVAGSGSKRQAGLPESIGPSAKRVYRGAGDVGGSVFDLGSGVQTNGLFNGLVTRPPELGAGEYQ
ncbi:MAG: hypothetical protein JWP48_2351, partial [Actinoallomurus sp.]|nr:hypothetical protein [Actinoallomurus sp.]